MHQIAPIEFVNLNFFSTSEGETSSSEASERELPLRHPIFLMAKDL